jgi:hypothetical protein
MSTIKTFKFKVIATFHIIVVDQAGTKRLLAFASIPLNYCFSFYRKKCCKFLNTGIKILNTLKVSDNRMTVATFAPVIAALTLLSVLGLTSQLNARREVIITWPDGTVTPFKPERYTTD